MKSHQQLEEDSSRQQSVPSSQGLSAPPSPSDSQNAQPKKRHFSLLRDFAPADFITLGNAAAGMSAVLASLRYTEGRDASSMWLAFALLPLAFVLDALDGFVARATKRASAYGGDLDSLADIVSFGVAPAVMGYALGLRGGWDMAILVFFVACGIGRLARFNVTALDLAQDDGKVSHFEGTPIPTSLLLVGLWAVALSQGAVHEGMWGGQLDLGMTLHPLSLVYAVSGSLMVTSTLKIPKP